MVLALLDVAAYVQAGAVVASPTDFPRSDGQLGLAWQVGFRVAPDVSVFGGYRSISLPTLSAVFELDHERIYWSLHEHMFPIGVRWTPVFAGRVSLDAEAFAELGSATSYNSASRLSANLARRFSDGLGARLGFVARIVDGCHPVSIGGAFDYAIAGHGDVDKSGGFLPRDTSATFGWISLDLFVEAGFR